LAIDKARAKARAAAAMLKPPFPAFCRGRGYAVAANGKVIGKPLDRTDAAAILLRLSGTRHCVISGVCVIPVTGQHAGTSAPSWSSLKTRG